ncbi:ABC transporter substrate-binding protein [Acrocarpospora macrocephala]|uniref:Iron ABC transporter substrate-binding protein n=1 Tax=Acrocarpospora macrocephala TaxID=150177 RepID=A0A5M3WMR9_9ACTN|nr:extracellular solute-binding protein [Acrocarpospora macrocephala]GES09790.1 iron ABC transporter substrate-binding protein [Acrocarpospora macrocephala]
MTASISRRRSHGPAHNAFGVLGAVVLALGLATACGGGVSGEAPANPIATEQVPSYYPSAYGDLIAAAKKEGGTLTIYSNTDQENWQPIFRDFQQKYPWVTKIAANNLDSDEVFQRVLSEQATGNSPADLLVSNAAQAWADFAARPGTLLEYASPEKDKLPEVGSLLPNVYAMSMDPLSIAYNTSLLPEKPTGLASLAAILAKDPAKYQSKITTRDVGGAFGFTVSHAFTEARPGSWTSLQSILPLARPETSSGTQLEKITSGEYVAGFFVSAAPAYPAVEKSGGLLQISFLDDGTVVLPRGIGIAAKAPHAATAKLFVDFVLSQEGQRAVAEGGLTSYRDGVATGDGLHTYQELVASVGEANVIVADYTKVPDDQVKTFVEKWNGLLGR